MGRAVLRLFCRRRPQFEDRPQFDEVETLAKGYLEAFVAGKLDRLDIVYTTFESLSRPYPVGSAALKPSTATAAPSSSAVYMSAWLCGSLA